MDKNKITYAQSAQVVATEFSKLSSMIDSLQKVWVDRGYGSSGENPLTETDITRTDGELVIPIDDIAELVNACDQIMKFLRGNSNATPGNYLKVLNRVRRHM